MKKQITIFLKLKLNAFFNEETRIKVFDFKVTFVWHITMFVGFKVKVLSPAPSTRFSDYLENILRGT